MRRTLPTRPMPLPTPRTLPPTRRTLPRTTRCNFDASVQTEALEFEEAAGICRQPLFLESAMRALILTAFTALALAACNKSGPVDNAANAADGLSADSITSNDI